MPITSGMATPSPESVEALPAPDARFASLPGTRAETALTPTPADVPLLTARPSPTTTAPVILGWKMQK